MTKILKRICRLLLLILLVILLTLLGQGYFRYRREIERKPMNQAVEEYTAREEYAEFDQIDEDFVHAVISVEDKRFFERKGYDFIALFRALYHNLAAGKMVEGGSTISEQIAKNLYLDGVVDGLEDKMAEIFLMMDLEKNYSKEELFALYANMNYYGDGNWGIRDAAKSYYSLDCNDLSLGKAAILAGIPNAPAIYQLSDGYDLAKKRQEWVLQTMLNNGYIDEIEMEEALKEDVKPMKMQ